MFRASAILTAVLVCSAHINGARLPPLHFVIARGDLASVEKLIASGADVNEFDAAGTSPLIAAVFSRNPEIVRYLLAHGSDVNARQRETQGTALSYAVETGHTDLAALLLNAGARVDFRYGDQRTLLHVAAARG